MELQSGGEIKELADAADKLSKRLVKDTTAWTNKKENLETDQATCQQACLWFLLHALAADTACLHELVYVLALKAPPQLSACVSLCCQLADEEPMFHCGTHLHCQSCHIALYQMSCLL